MQIDIRGKINEKKLAYNNTLLPVFEAVVNSIQAIEEGSSTQIGLIEIEIIRSKQSKLNLESEKMFPEITGFFISDNGVGFTEKNFDSFNHAHSTYKSLKGGKGIGRFTWLKAFSRAEIESRFPDNGIWYFRTFNFEPTKQGIEKHQIIEVDNSKIRSTQVRLIGLKEDYKKWCNNDPEDIAIKIIQHCFVFFLSPKCPRISISDFGRKIIVNDLFVLFTKGQAKNIQLKIRELKFSLNIVRFYKTKVDNRIHYCANTREVYEEKISLEIPEFDNSLIDEDGNDFSIAVYVEGEYLNSNVNEERTEISFKNGEILFPNETSQDELRKSITDIIQNEFSNQIELLSQGRFEIVRKFINNNPRYKQLLKYRTNDIKKIPSNLPEDKLEIELFKIQQSLDLEVKKEASSVLRFINDDVERKNFMEKHQNLYSKIIEVGNTKLADYVLHRKLVLELFENLLKSKSTEQAVHNLIFPLKTLSDEIGFEDHNLWIIDEKLSYHKYLASDKQFKNVSLLNSISKERPDIIVFNRPFVFANDDKPYQSIVLIEFKRPNRDDYTENENPISQINRYSREIIDGIAKDKHGREFNILANTPIYAFIICDFTPKLITKAKDAGYKKLPSGNGFFFYNDNYNMYAEIISFDKLLSDSKERNKVLFDKLNLT